MDNKVNILDIEIDALTKAEATKKMRGLIFRDRQSLVTTPNPEMLVAATRDREFKYILEKSDLKIPDGVGLMWAAYVAHEPLPKDFFMRFYVLLWRFILGEVAIVFNKKRLQRYLPEQISGTDMVYDIAQIAKENDLSIFLLGSYNKTGERCAKKLQELYPDLKIAGTHEGNFSEVDDKNSRQIINESGANILLVAYGHSRQEKWLARNLEKLPHVKMGIGVGGAFDYISGDIKRAPKFMRLLGLEWLFRMIIQPSRVFRIITATWTFPNMVVKWKLLNKNNG
ncbi:MAG: WecB/TagA/CpsF family glycosyltransferase [bacterium]